MKTAGIICEYNPFHLGHLRQFRLIREQLGQDCAIVCLMSGNYVQRGEPAMWDKFTRAKAALNCGADLVLELPITGVLQSAEGFAATGVEILSSLGCIDYLCFGVEAGDAGTFMSLAEQIDTPEFTNKLRAGLDAGLPYAAARQQALEDEAGMLDTPNNILALEYCRAILKTNSSMKPLPVIRNGSYHAISPQEGEPSATAVRNIFPHGHWERYVPVPAAEILKQAPWYQTSFGERAVLSRLRALDDVQWETCAHGSEGLWRKAMKAARTQPNLEGIISSTKSKRYPRTRIQRLLLCAYLGISDEVLKSPIPYVRVLAASEQGRVLLRQAKKQCDLPIVNAGQTPQNKPYYELECLASGLFTLFSADPSGTTATMEQSGRTHL